MKETPEGSIRNKYKNRQTNKTVHHVPVSRIPAPQRRERKRGQQQPKKKDVLESSEIFGMKGRDSGKEPRQDLAFALAKKIVKLDEKRFAG